MNEKQKAKIEKSPLYQDLPNNVIAVTDSRHSYHDIKDFISNILPASDAHHVTQDLHKKNTGINLNAEIQKKAKPRTRKIGLSQKERRAVGLFRLPRFTISYDEALPMNKIWEAYMWRFLNLDHLQKKEWYNPKSGNLWDQMSVTLLKADYHGALLKVASSLCTSMIGLEGIVVIDTKFTFKVVGKDDVCRTLPKESCVFEIFLKNYKFKVFGKYFCIRSSERSTKKIKCLFIPSL